MRRRAVAAPLGALFAFLMVAAGPGAAGAAPPVYAGSFDFPSIESAAAPEEYSWQVDLAPRQELRQASPTEVDVVYVDGTEAFSITAERAHAADGARVPTTLEKTGEDIVTLIVHHRAGNPAAAGAPFDYPITAGEGWEGGYDTVFVKGPPDETELREMSERERTEREIIEASPLALTEPPPTITCRVPSLHGYSLRGAKNRLRAAHCGIGAVHLAAGATVGKGKVVKQFYAAGTELAAGASVAVKLSASRGRG